jgi:aspartate 1-decarboxylase
MLKSKVHRAIVTDADVNYEGSITIDPVLMEAADILPYEQVDVVNINNGARLTTYAIEGTRGDGELAINGAAARLVNVADIIIVLSYQEMEDEAARTHQPKLVYVDGQNRIHHTIDVPEEAVETAP